MSRFIRLCGSLAEFLILAPGAVADDNYSLQDWALLCQDEQSCRLERRVFVQGAEKAPLVHMIFQAPSQAQGLVVLLRIPLGVLLRPGIQLLVDRGAPQTFPVHHCGPEGCLVMFQLTNDLRRILERGREAQVRFNTLDGRRVRCAYVLTWDNGRAQSVE